VEYIPQLRAITASGVEITDGMALAPSSPGIGIEWDADAIDNLRAG
jgi:L-alanine-DL-glutamate epimerase-like enolase superfamily enzyme